MTAFVTKYKFAVGLGLVALAATAYLLYRRSKQAESGLGGDPVSPYAAVAPRALGSSSILPLPWAPPGSGSTAPEPTPPEPTPQPPAADPVTVGAQTFAPTVQAAAAPPAFNDQGQLTAEYVEYITGAPVAQAGTTVDFNGTTYDVGGTPEFSPGNYNPNSPAGVLAMNEAIAAAGMGNTQAGGSAIAPPPPDLYTADNAAQAAAVAAGPAQPDQVVAF